MIYRQGDIVLTPVENLPEGNELERDGQGRIVLAYGESTGHAHAIHDVDVQWIDGGGEQYVVSAAPFDLVHEEHDTIALPPGTYHVIRQREYTPEEIRQVRD